MQVWTFTITCKQACADFAAFYCSMRHSTLLYLPRPLAHIFWKASLSTFLRSSFDYSFQVGQPWVMQLSEYSTGSIWHQVCINVASHDWHHTLMQDWCLVEPVLYSDNCISQSQMSDIEHLVQSTLFTLQWILSAPIFSAADWIITGTWKARVGWSVHCICTQAAASTNVTMADLKKVTDLSRLVQDQHRHRSCNLGCIMIKDALIHDHQIDNSLCSHPAIVGLI